MVKVFRAFSKDGDAEHWATDDLEMLEEEREALSSQGWGIEAYHRGLKQCWG
jgi:putative transposase